MRVERSELRAADADRKRVMAEPERHYVDGRLTSDEYGERVSQALAARTYGELDALVRDLPATPTPAPEPDVAHGAHAGSWAHQDFRAHLLTYVMVMALLVAIWLLTSPGGYFWPIWPMLGWGIAIASHGLARSGWLGHGGRRRGRRESE